MYSPTSDAEKVERPRNPRSDANIFQILTFSWILNVFKTGRKRDLNENDLYVTLDEHKSSLLGNELEKRWRNELVNAKKANRKPSLLRALLQMFAGQLLMFGIMQILIESVLRVVRPLLFGGLLAYFSPAGTSNVDKKHAYIYASCLVANLLANILCDRYVLSELSHCGMKMRVACSSAIYRKALRLSKQSVEESTVGQAINLLSNDVNRFDMGLKFVNYIWLGPLMATVITYSMWMEIGVSCLFGLFLVLMVIPFQAWLGKKTSEYRSKIAPKTDKRVRLMNEIVSGIQVIKMFTWEKTFALLVQYARKMEIREIKRATYTKIVLQSLRICYIRLALFISIMAYVLLGNEINTQQVFVIISYFGIMRTVMVVFFPKSITSLSEILISIERIQNFLLYDEKRKETALLLKPAVKNVSYENNNFINDEKSVKINTEKKRSTANVGTIVISDATAKWSHDQTENTLNGIELSVDSGHLAAIIGSVGSGKSSLIQVILGELPLTKGTVSVGGAVSYASQELWLFNGSVRQNIIFSSPIDEPRYEKVIRACALDKDILQFPDGDRTIVGDRGVALSGGQRARINLARAVYKQADIYLLDDPLSAVDTSVGKHLFEKCINGYLKGKTRILITHQTQYLQHVDKIVVIENSNKVAEGPYWELRSKNLDIFKSLGSLDETSITYGKNNRSKEEDESNSHPLRTLSRHQSLKSVDKSNELRVIKNEPVKMAKSQSSGNVRNVYSSYILAGGTVCQIIFIVLVCISTEILGTGGDWWISYWVNLEDHVFPNATNLNSTDNSTLTNVHFFQTSLLWPISHKSCVFIYFVLVCSLLVAVFLRIVVMSSFFARCSMNLHNNMFNAITRATMFFFNTNSTGQILNRFTNDMGMIDENLILPIVDTVSNGLWLIGILFVVGQSNFYFVIPAFSIVIVCYYATLYYLSLSRSIKFLEGASRSPVYAHMNTSLRGLTTIRAFQAEGILTKEFDAHQDLLSSVSYLFIYSSNAFTLAVYLICLIFFIVLTFSLLIFEDENTYGGNVGLVITQTLYLMGMMQLGLTQSTEIDNYMTCVRRVLEYTNVPQESALESHPSKKPPEEWPSKGQIDFRKFSLRYSPDSPHVLKNVNIKIQPMEKIGIVGRTGAGKSSLISALFRLAVHEGNIIIDGIEIHELGLHDLRSRLSIIPQDPVLFSGTVRTNLDPFDEYPDHSLWDALEEVQLKDIVQELPEGLNSKIFEGGANFSVGQRQLLCLARGIIRSNKILILDEATANIDSKTDALIQNTIKNKLKLCTILTIAHRLDTVMDSDKVLVMDSGTMVEFDHPHCLLRNENGFFYKMVEQTGGATADSLRTMAADSFKTLHGTADPPAYTELDGRSRLV